MERSGIVSDFSSTRKFNPEAVFGLPDNVSVQSTSLGLVNNQLPHLLTAVPLPAPL